MMPHGMHANWYLIWAKATGKLLFFPRPAFTLRRPLLFAFPLAWPWLYLALWWIISLQGSCGLYSVQWEWGSTNHDPGIIFCSATNLAAFASHQLLKPPGSGPIIYYLLAYFYIGAVAAFPGALFLLLQTFPWVFFSLPPPDQLRSHFWFSGRPPLSRGSRQGSSHSCRFPRSWNSAIDTEPPSAEAKQDTGGNSSLLPAMYMVCLHSVSSVSPVICPPSFWHRFSAFLVDHW